MLPTREKSSKRSRSAPARGRHNDAGDHDDGAVAEREPRADGDGPAARGHEPPRHEVDGRDVVGVECVPQAQSGHESAAQRREPRVVVQHDARARPRPRWPAEQR